MKDLGKGNRWSKSSSKLINLVLILPLLQGDGSALLAVEHYQV